MLPEECEGTTAAITSKWRSVYGVQREDRKIMAEEER